MYERMKLELERGLERKSEEIAYIYTMTHTHTYTDTYVKNAFNIYTYIHTCYYEGKLFEPQAIFT